MFFKKIRYKYKNKLGISHLQLLLRIWGNDLATVTNSAICCVFLSNNSCSAAKLAISLESKM